MDKAACDYTPYGQTSTETADDKRESAEGLNPFTCAYQFNNGDTHLGHRYYSPQVNQFTRLTSATKNSTTVPHATPPTTPIRRVC